MTLGQNSPGKDLKVRYLYLGAAFLLGLLVLSVRLYRLQITRGDEFAARSVANFVKEIRIPADRGMILDDTGRILVDGRPSFDVMVTPAFCANCRDEVLPRLAAWLGWGGDELEEVWKLVQRARRDAPFRPVPVRIDISRDLADVLDAHLTELPGVEVQATPHRNYRTGPVASHVIGYMNEITTEELERLNAKGGKYALGDYVGRRGMEKAFESYLRGTDGERKQVVDAKGKPIPGLSDLVGSDKVIPPVPGNNVVLSLDMRLQEEAERVFPGKAGGVVMVEVKTGFVKTLWSKPGYDPNLLTGRITAAQLAEVTRDPLKPMMNRVTQMHYSPGSTFKVVTALAALREGTYTGSTHVNCPGGYRLGRRVWRCDKESGHGSLEVTHAIQQSCDVYFYHAADLMGIDPIAREARDLGLGSPTGITGLLEEPGIIPDEAYHDRVTPGGYQRGMALNTSIGQGDVNVTPIQMVMLYAALANGGKLYRPQLVRRIEAPDGKVLKAFEPELVRTVEMKPEHRALVLEGLRMVVNERGGTAYWRRLKDIHVAGKTGTAQVVRLGEVRHKAEDLDYWVRDHAWFAAFAPVEDPEIAVVVLNEHSGFGASNAAPVAMAMIQKYFDLKKEDADRAATLAYLDGAPVPSGEVSATTEVATQEVQEVAAPAPAPAVEPAAAPAPEPEQKAVAQVEPAAAPGIGGGPSSGGAVTPVNGGPVKALVDPAPPVVPGGTASPTLAVPGVLGLMPGAPGGSGATNPARAAPGGAGATTSAHAAPGAAGATTPTRAAPGGAGATTSKRAATGPAGAMTPAHATTPPSGATTPTRAAPGSSGATSPTHARPDGSGATTPTRVPPGGSGVTTPTRAAPGGSGSTTEPHAVPSGSGATMPTHAGPGGSAATTPTRAAPGGSAATTPTRAAPGGSGKATPTRAAPGSSGTTTPTHVAPGASGATTPTHAAPGGSGTTTPTHAAPGGSGSTTPTHVAPGGSGTTMPTHAAPGDSGATSPARAAPGDSGATSPARAAPGGSGATTPAHAAPAGSGATTPSPAAPGPTGTTRPSPTGDPGTHPGDKPAADSDSEKPKKAGDPTTPPAKKKAPAAAPTEQPPPAEPPPAQSEGAT